MVIMRNDEAWDDVSGGLLDRFKEEARMHEWREALQRSVEERRVRVQEIVGQVGGHEQGHG